MEKSIKLIRKTENRKGLFKCYCGNEFEALIQNVKRKHTRSCGCYRIEVTTKHGDAKDGNWHYLYSTWDGIKQRCYNENCKAYKNYGGRGITMHPKWIDNYLAFKKYILNNLGERPKGMTLDRIKNEKNYVPNNLRWATRKTQNSNKRGKKLNALQNSIIIHSLDLGLSGKYLADVFNITPSAVCYVNKNKRK